jgi:endonuclease/exonuclease/phosphatase (EEP) superfamily protein YafD
LRFSTTILGIVPLACALRASGQLRIVQYNAGAVKPGLSTILEQIGHESVNGVAKPIDVLLVQEQASASDVAAMAATLNTIYGAGAYAAAPYTGFSSGGGLPGMVYRTSTVNLLAATAIGTVNISSNARQTLRYRVCPVGYSGSGAEIYIYNSHFKANGNDTTSDAARRNVEAQTNRANADALGAGANVIFAGDLNIYSGTQAAFVTLTAAGSAKGYDPVSAPAVWSGSANRIFHTQSPVTSQQYQDQVTGGMNDRFDFELVTANLQDGHGLSIIPGSYHAFGNNGSHPLSGAINAGSNTWNPPGLTVSRTTVLNALTTSSDHIPVVADYQLPAKMSASVTQAAPPRVIVGGAAEVKVSVANVAPVVAAIGADVLGYTVGGTGNVSGSATGTIAALATANVHTLSFDTSTPGAKSGNVSVMSTSQAVANGSFSQAVSTTVFAHAGPSFSDSGSQTDLTVDLGVVAMGPGSVARSISLFNLPAGAGVPTAALDLDGATSSGSTSRLSADLTPFKNLAAGDSHAVAVSLQTDQTGVLTTGYTLALSDEDLPGAASTAALNLTLKGQVALGGDATLDGRVTFEDLVQLAQHYNAAPGEGIDPWSAGDFNRDGFVGFDDLVMLAQNYNGSVGGSAGLNSDLARAFASVPEPGVGFAGLLVLGALGRLRGRRR